MNDVIFAKIICGLPICRQKQIRIFEASIPQVAVNLPNIDIEIRFPNRQPQGLRPGPQSSARGKALDFSIALAGHDGAIAVGIDDHVHSGCAEQVLVVSDLGGGEKRKKYDDWLHIDGLSKSGP